jgi:hypothetical protein
MSLANTLPQKLAEWQPRPGRQELIVSDSESGWTAALTADRRDELGCLVWELALRRASPQAGDLAGWAERITAKVTSLLEPLKVVEIDPTRNEGLLRSESPQRRGEKVLYYEVRLKGTTEAVLRRYQAVENTSGRRQQIAFALTHEGVGKLAGDLTAN